MSTSADSNPVATDTVRGWLYWPRAMFCGATLALVYAVVWFIRHTYLGMDDDAQLYALQAIAHLDPRLAANEVFLKYGSQDDFTLFTPFFAWCIRLFGLPSAQALLTIVFHAWSGIAGWWIARSFASRETAWLAAGILIVVPGTYGALGILEYGENFLTARLPSEALVLTAIALFLHRRRWWSCAALLAALLMHPLMAAPGIAAIALLTPTQRLQKSVWAAAGLGVVLLVPVGFFLSSGPLAAMDDQWFAVVRQRSDFMFLDQWRWQDWDWLLLSVLTLTLIGLVSNEDRTRRFVHAVLYVGMLGLALTAIITYVLPIQILVQGQPWRWMWLVTFTAIALLAPTLASCLRRRDRIGIATCVLCVSAWIVAISIAYSGFMAAPLALLAVAIYAARDRLAEPYLRYVHWLAGSSLALATISIALSVLNVARLEFFLEKEAAAVELARNMFALTFPAAAAIAIAWLLTVRSRNLATTALVLAATLGAVVGVLPDAHAGLMNSEYVSSAHLRQWRDAVDHRRNVLWFENPVAVWFLLDSPSYLSVSQSAGIAFSPQTTAEIVRRAKVLEPLAGHAGLAIDRQLKRKMLPLTLQSLVQICADPALGYVVSREKLAVAHLAQDRVSRWRGLHLYSCDTVVASNSRPSLAADAELAR